MSGTVDQLRRWFRAPFIQGFLLLLILVTLFLAKSLFTDQVLIAADLLFELDPLWQSLAPTGFMGPANQALSDQVFQFYPWQKFMRAELVQGRLPLWNPYVNSGHPLIANAQSALFDPFNLMALLSPLAKSFVVVVFLRLLCAGTFTLLLALEIGLSRMAAYLAMVVFTFAGPQIVWLLYPKASVLVWLPAILFLSLRLIRTGKWHYVTGVGLAMAAQLVGGHPETSLYIVLVWLAFVGYWLWALPLDRPSLRRTLVQLLLAGVLGVGAGAIQWLPLAEALLHSEILATRSQASLSWQAIFFQWREWLAAIAMLMPDFFGNPRYQNYWNPFSNYIEQTIFVGVLPLGLTVLVLIIRVRRTAASANGLWWQQVIFLLIMVGLTLAMALRLPGFPLLAELPALSVTNPGRLRGVYMLLIALLAGCGLELVRHNLRGNGQLRLVGLLARILLLLGSGAALIAAGSYLFVTRYADQLIELGRAQAAASQANPFFFRPLEEYLLLAQVRVEQMQALLHPAHWRMYLPLMLALLMLGTVAIVRRVIHTPAQRGQVISLAIIALVVGELWLFGVDFNPTIAPELLYPTPELVDVLLEEAAQEENDPYRVMGTGLALVPNVGMVFGLEDVRGYDPVAPRRYMELMNRLVGAARVGHHLLFTQADASLLDFLNVRYAFAAGELGEGWTPLHEQDGVTLYANQEAMARAFMVYAAHFASTPQESLEITLAPDFDFRNRVVLEGIDAPDAVTLQAQPSVAPSVEITHRTPGEMTLQVESAASGYLVLSEPYMPGWVATVDAEPTEVLIANHAFRALQLPAGSHTVRFAYQPVSFMIGMWITLVSLGLLILIVPFSRRLFLQRQGATRP